MSVLGAAAALLTASLPASAHHAFGAEFDATRPVLLKGKIVKMEWVNPHTWIHVEITKPDGSKEVWMVEGGSPNSLLRRGANKDSFPVGTEVVVDGYQARDHNELRANARNVTFPDGRKLFLGSTGTGAPNPEDFPSGKVTQPAK
ncbi:MAG: hypothetical protein LAP38_01365 [Acidobacteriia bacterium]|nr:hypothetical protein [Terriglobia bacterium]